MKIYGIEIEEAPFNDEYLDDCIKNTDFIVKIDSIKIQNIKQVIDTVLSKGCKLIYIHSYSQENITTLGFKESD